ncbi:hypothetical protein GGS20DRAFT_596408 [Poronia punctata]|nr:hypothetical protein GGS20DRAFT_596408 [Poronia punctata]
MSCKMAAVLSAAILASAWAHNISDCAAGCVSGVLANSAAMGCANGDTLCVCAQVDSFHDGIRDCITGACPNDVSGIPLAITYGDGQCALLLPVAIPTSATLPGSATSSTSVSVSIEPSDIPSSPSVPAPEISTSTASQGTQSPQTTKTGTLETVKSTTVSSLQITHASTPGLPSPTTAGNSQTSSSEKAASGTELSTAVKAGIGAGAGVAGLAVAIITACVCLRRRQAQTTNGTRGLKISEPMSSSPGNQHGTIHGGDSDLFKPISTTVRSYGDTGAQPTSPTSTYSYSPELESHARRYEDLLPRTQPRTMI